MCFGGCFWLVDLVFVVGFFFVYFVVWIFLLFCFVLVGDLLVWFGVVCFVFFLCVPQLHVIAFV